MNLLIRVGSERGESLTENVKVNEEFQSKDTINNRNK